MQIDRFRFGSIRIDGVDYTKDVLIVDRVVHCPWWRSAGSHIFAPADLMNVIEAAPEIVCLGTGAIGMVTVTPATFEAFAKAGTEVVVDRTGSIIEAFNTLSEAGRNVAAALHLTC